VVPRSARFEASSPEIYIDSRLRVGREGLAHDPGGTVAGWQQRPSITVEMMERSAIGELPDRLVVRSADLTLERAAAGPPRLGSPYILVIRAAASALTGDDARRACNGNGNGNGNGDGDGNGARGDKGCARAR
jgi:hypothetical protein